MKHYPVTTTGQFATKLAGFAQQLKQHARDQMRDECSMPELRRPLHALAAELRRGEGPSDPEHFFDAYAQTVTYGLLAARWLSSCRSTPFAREHLNTLLPSTSRFVRELFGRMVHAQLGPKLSAQVDGITEHLARTDVEALFRDQQDPVIHLYQHFLDAYDPQQRRQRGVYYTPDEVVSFVVRTVHRALQQRFGLPLGLADTACWTEFAATAGVSVPDGIDGDTSFIHILDPAAGTGTFLLHIIKVVHETMMATYADRGLDALSSQRAWVQYVRSQLLPRVRGVELMMAPYIVSHLRLGFALQQTGFLFGQHDRLRLVLGDALGDRARASYETSPPASIVLGNPPYRRGTRSRSDFAEQLVKPFKDAVRSERNIQPLSDDYITFLSLGDRLVQQARFGILALVTNSTYLSGRLHRGIREHLVREYDLVGVTDLHGSLKVPLADRLGHEKKLSALDENVFEIQQGVAVLHAERRGGAAARRRGELVAVHDLIGTRTDKLNWMSERSFSQKCGRFEGYTKIEPTAPMYVLTTAEAVPHEYASFLPLPKLFAFYSVSGKPGKDELLVSFCRDDVIAKLARRREQLARGRVKHPTETERKLGKRPEKLAFDPQRVCRYAYRPGDSRWTYYDPEIWTRGVSQLTSRLDGTPVLLTTKIVKDSSFSHVWVTRGLADVIFLSSTSSVNCYSFPGGVEPSVFAEALGREVAAEAAFEYIYAVLHSPSYRRRYAEGLRYDFPAIPVLPSGQGQLFDELTIIGRALRDLHLFEETYIPRDDGVRFVDGGDRVIRRVGQQGRKLSPGAVAGRGAVWVNGVSRFEELPVDAWSFQVGGYQLLYKWLANRRKVHYELNDADIQHFCRLVHVCTQTMVLMHAVDKLIDAHGGWPRAFGDKGHQ